MSSSEIIFHEYAVSPFSEKIRRIFGYKGIAYRSVEQPMWMPKPHLVPLTGGYRRIPVMQIGADVYCDTACIARKLEELHPDNTLFPDGNAAAAEAVAAWADRQLFFACVPLVFAALADALPEQLLDDRRKMRPDMTVENLTAAAPACRTTLRAACDRFNATFARHDFVLGSAFSIADAALYHCLWFARNAPEGGEIIAASANVGAWMRRLEEMGNGELTAMEPDDALTIARESTPRARTDDTGDIAPGTVVGIAGDDLPGDVFRGEVISAGPQEIVIRRRDPELGELAQHFPRAGYLVHIG